MREVLGYHQLPFPLELLLGCPHLPVIFHFRSPFSCMLQWLQSCFISNSIKIDKMAIIIIAKSWRIWFLTELWVLCRMIMKMTKTAMRVSFCRCYSYSSLSLSLYISVEVPCLCISLEVSLQFLFHLSDRRLVSNLGANAQHVHINFWFGTFVTIIKPTAWPRRKTRRKRTEWRSSAWHDWIPPGNRK